MKQIFSVILISLSLSVFSQQDSLQFKSDRQKSFQQILDLHEDGALVFRVLLNKKSADLYRKAGKDKVADRIEAKQNKRNLLLALAFLDSTFNFCPVYIIESKDYGRVINKETSGYFLDENLKVDPSITLGEKNIYFVEIGDVYEALRDESFMKSEVGSTPIVQTALVIKDENLNQLVKPFPFFIPLEGVHLDLANLIVYTVGKNQKKANSNGIIDYHNYMKDKHKNLTNKDLFLIDKVQFLNLKLHGFFPKAYNFRNDGGFNRN